MNDLVKNIREYLAAKPDPKHASARDLFDLAGVKYPSTLRFSVSIAYERSFSERKPLSLDDGWEVYRDEMLSGTPGDEETTEAVDALKPYFALYHAGLLSGEAKRVGAYKVALLKSVQDGLQNLQKPFEKDAPKKTDT